MANGESYGVFTKGDQTRRAGSQADAVYLRFHGWQEQATSDDGDVLRGAELDDALEAANLPKTGTAAEKRARLAEYQSSNAS